MKSEPAAGQAQIGQDLRIVNRGQRFHRFHLDDHCAIDKQIDPVSRIQLYALIDNWEGDLGLDGSPARPQRVRQADFVSGLEQSGAKCGMDLDRRIDHIASDFIDRARNRFERSLGHRGYRQFGVLRALGGASLSLRTPRQ